MNIPILETERLYIRPFEANDFKAFHAFMTNPESTKTLLFTDEQKTEKGIRELFDFTVNSYSDSMKMASFAVADKQTNQYVGSVGFAPDFDNINLQVYWSINLEHTGKRYGTESSKALIDELKKQSDKKIRAYCHPENSASAAIAKNIGMKELGQQFVEVIEQNSLVFEI